MKNLIVLSGGMDSTTAIQCLRAEGCEVNHAINFTYGSKHNAQERKAVTAIAKFYNLKVAHCHLDFIESAFKSDLLSSGGDIPEGHYADPSMKRTVVPFRNGIMLSIAAGYAESLGLTALVIGNHAGDHAIYPDCRADFILPMGEAIYRGTYANIILKSPFLKITKVDIARLGGQLKVPYELTYSCYKGGEIHCGVCGTCFERKEAFKDAGLADPTEYLQ